MFVQRVPGVWFFRAGMVQKRYHAVDTTWHGIALCDSARYPVLSAFGALVWSGPFKFINTHQCLLPRTRRRLREVRLEIHGLTVG